MVIEKLVGDNGGLAGELGVLGNRAGLVKITSQVFL